MGNWRKGEDADASPVCGALSDGDQRYPRPDGELCNCKDGWGGINCNGESTGVLGNDSRWRLSVAASSAETLSTGGIWYHVSHVRWWILTRPVCKDDRACKGFKLRNPVSGMVDGDDDDDDEIPLVCYKGGVAIEQNFQMCDVTNRKIIDTIPNNKPPQVTFSCSNGGPSSNSSLFAPSFGLGSLAPDESGTCNFQFWVDRIESFYCALDGCSWEARDNAGERGAKTRVLLCRWLTCRHKRDALPLRQD